jgi:cilia- and flagella-associated protein 52
VGLGHSGGVTKVAVAPDQRLIVSVGDEGAVLLWNVPPQYAPP